MIRRAAAALAVAAAALTACTEGSPAAGDTDAPVDPVTVERSTYENYEDFNNLVVFCDGTTRVYTTTEWPVVYITDDPQCGGRGENVHVGPSR